MNRIAIPLFAIGWLCIAGGLILGFTNIETMVPETDVLGDTVMVEGASWTIFFSYLFAGIITGCMMFGFAEILNLLQKGNTIRERIEENRIHERKMREGA